MAKVLADFFADHHAGGGYPGRGIDDSWFSLRQIIDHAVENGVEWVVSLGDAVDAVKTFAAGPLTMHHQLRHLVKAGVKFGYIDGNHDKRQVSWLYNPDFVALDMQVIFLGGYRFLGLDFRFRDDVQAVLAKEASAPEVNGLLMHQGWQDFMGWEDSFQCAFADVPGNVTRLATGDFHGKSVVTTARGKAGQKLVVANPGPTSMQDISEPDEKFFMSFMDDGSFKLVPLRTRVVLRSDALHRTEDFEEFVADLPNLLDDARNRAARLNLPDELCRPMLQVMYSAKLPDVPRRLQRLVGDGAHLFWKEMHDEKDGSSPESVGVAGHKGPAFTPASMLAREIDPDDKDDPLAKEKFALAERLVTVKTREQAVAVINDWKDAQLIAGG